MMILPACSWSEAECKRWSKNRLARLRLISSKRVPRSWAPTKASQGKASKHTIKRRPNERLCIGEVRQNDQGWCASSCGVQQMTQDNVDLEKVHLFNLAFGLVKSKSPKRSPIPPVPRGRRRASTALQKIHWSAVADESKLKNSVWACQAADDSELDETDIQKLVSLGLQSSQIKPRKPCPNKMWTNFCRAIVAGIIVCCGSNQQSCRGRKKISYY
jgi:hypothetical protein